MPAGIAGLIAIKLVADNTESEGHHPLMHVFYSKIEIEVWTLVILGLSENDIILAV
jgi:pterin-4a-carbinolamine dehydratase